MGGRGRGAVRKAERDEKSWRQEGGVGWGRKMGGRGRGAVRKAERDEKSWRREGADQGWGWEVGPEGGRKAGMLNEVQSAGEKG